jgi:Uma2 family endonuclease
MDLDIKEMINEGIIFSESETEIINDKSSLIFFEGSLIDFYNLEERKADFIDGGIIVMQSPASFKHEKFFGVLFSKMHLWVEEQKLGEVLGSRFLVSFDEKNKFEPDIVFISKDNTGEIKENEFTGIPDIIVEIVSKTSKKYDLMIKRDIYRKYRVKEMYFIDIIDGVIIIDILVNQDYESINIVKGEFESKVLNGFKFKL